MDVAIRSAAVRIKDAWDSYWQRGCANSGPWIPIGTAAQQIVVGGFLIRTAVKIVIRCAVFFPTVHSLLEFILRAGLA